MLMLISAIVAGVLSLYIYHSFQTSKGKPGVPVIGDLFDCLIKVNVIQSETTPSSSAPEPIVASTSGDPSTTSADASAGVEGEAGGKKKHKKSHKKHKSKSVDGKKSKKHKKHHSKHRKSKKPRSNDDAEKQEDVAAPEAGVAATASPASPGENQPAAPQ
uniref:Uncharacterized protein n=1 Tax=Steinernema glaseri TaxID=37863 RepID=A0A1I8AN58_9BILA